MLKEDNRAGKEIGLSRLMRNCFIKNWEEICRRWSGSYVTVSANPERFKEEDYLHGRCSHIDAVIKRHPTLESIEEYLLSLPKFIRRTIYKHHTKIPSAGTPFPEEPRPITSY